MPQRREFVDRPNAGSNDRLKNAIKREKAHYDEHRRYLLHFLEMDKTAFDRWLIRQILRTWDRQIAFIRSEWIRDRVVLEVGCGNPRVLFLFREMGAREAIGIDLSRKFVETGLKQKRTYVHARSPAVRPEAIRLIYGDVNSSITDGLAVDTIACFQALHHIDLAAFVNTCRRLLTRRGYVIISDPVGDHPLRGLGNLIGRMSGLLSPGERAISPGRVMSAFADGGFETVEFRSLNPTLEIYFQLTELLTPLSGRLAFYAKLPMALLRPLETALENTLLKLFPRLGWRYFAVFRKED